MKILLTGGGSGGHFYPLIAVAESIRELAKKENLYSVQLYFMSDSAYDSETLVAHDIKFIPITAGKMRLYSSISNFFDYFRIIYGIIIAFWKVFALYPDVIFSKGAYASFPVLVAARFFRIPVVIHESDSVPGRTNLWAAKFAKKIGISYPETIKYFPEAKVAYTGNPLRKEIINLDKNAAKERLKLDNNIPTILIIGGSLGSQIINERILNSLPNLLEKYQILHQTGKNNIQEVSELSKIILNNNPNAGRYRIFDYLNDSNLILAAGAADLIISRAGSTIFEIASWGVPSIVIPITESNGNHQRENAYAYARSGAASVIEESNLTTNVFIGEIDRILQSKELQEKMIASTKNFVKLDAADKIAQELIDIALSHEK